MDNRLIELMRQAWAETLKYFRSENLPTEKKWSWMNDVLSIADQASNNILMKWLYDLWVEQILSEESVQTETFDRNKEVWIIDPIDGTRLFIKWDDGYCILLAKCLSWEIVLWIAIYPWSDEIIYAEKGEWCWRVKWTELSERIEIFDEITSYTTCKVRLRPERSPEEKDMKLLYQLVKREWLEQQDVVFWRETREFLLWKIDFFIESYPKLWKRDIAPSSLFVKEVWGFMCDMYWNNINFTSENQTYDIPVIVWNRWLQDILLQKIHGNVD